MLRSTLIERLTEEHKLDPKTAEAAIEAIFNGLEESLCRGENIEIRGFGAFHVKRYDGYQGRNPKTGQVIDVKPKRDILFRTGRELRERLNRARAAGLAETPPAAAGPKEETATG